MTVIHYIVDPFTPHGRAVISFTRSFVRFAYDVFRRYRLRLLDHLIVTDMYGAVNPERFTKDSKVLKLIEDLRTLSGVCTEAPTGLYSVYDYAIVLCLKLEDRVDKALSLKVAAHEFIHFMTHAIRDWVIEGFMRALASDIPAFKDIVDIVTACYDKASETVKLGTEARKRLAESVPELKDLEDTCVEGFQRFRAATWRFVSQIVAEYIALNYFVLLHRLPVLRIESILSLPVYFRYYAEYLVSYFLDTIAEVVPRVAYAYYRLSYPEKPATEAHLRATEFNTVIKVFTEELKHGDHPKLKGFMHETLLSMLSSGAVLPADVAPKYPELYEDVKAVAKVIFRTV
jgi:hypothetical protein